MNYPESPLPEVSVNYPEFPLPEVSESYSASNRAETVRLDAHDGTKGILRFSVGTRLMLFLS